MIDALWRASVNGAVAVVVVWAISRLFGHRLPARARTWLWWCAAARFLVALVWQSPLELRLLPAPIPTAEVTVQGAATSANLPSTLTVPSTANIAVEATAPDRGLPWPSVLLTLWLLGVVAAGVTGFRRWREARRLVRNAADAPSEWIGLARVAASRVGLSRRPPVRVSAEVASPMVVGVIRPVVILPADRFGHLDTHAQILALAHECEHIRRRDLRLGLLPALSEALFFFHPFARAAAREYALWRESACDDAVIHALDAEPATYGRLLLGLGVSRPRIGLAAAGASVSAANLKRRLLMLETPEPSRRALRLMSALTLVAAVAIALPVRLTARAAAQVPPAPAHPARPPAPPTPPPAAPLMPMATVPAGPPAPARLAPPAGPPALPPSAPLMPMASVPAGPPVPPAIATVPPVAPPAMAPIPPMPSVMAVRDTPDFAFVLSRDGKTSTMSGSSDDVERARRFMRSDEPLFWFRMDGKEYVVRDTEIIRQVEAAWAPLNEIGKEQGKLGAQQGELGKQQGAIGARQGDIGKDQGELGVKQAELAVAQAQANLAMVKAKSDDDREAAKRQEAQVQDQMRELEGQMNALSSKMRAEAEPMNELGQKMNELGRQMSVLGEQMKVAAEKGNADTRAIAKRAIASGKAQPAQ
jgi:beta-lactamase regulating signal transducer with metallopeptidase domain